MDTISPLLLEKHSQFHVFSTRYKIIGDHAITLDVLIPKKLARGKRPVLVKIHGGALITGSSSFLGWFAPWIFDLALLHSAIIVAPNYRLLPEATGLDIFSDMHDFFKWIFSDLQSFVTKSKPDVQIDAAKLLVHGDSAGGYLAILSTFNNLSPHPIRAVIAAYPFLILDDPWFSQPSPNKGVLHMPQLSSSIMDTHLASLTPSSVVSSANPPQRLDLMLVTAQQGLFPKFLGSDVRLYPVRMLEEGLVSPKHLPPIFILHGQQDSAVPVEGTETFVRVLEAREGGAGKVLVRIIDGDHGFDNSDDVTMGMEWLSEGLAFVTKAWLK